MASTKRSIARSDTESVPPTSLAINKTQRPSLIHLSPDLDQSLSYSQKVKGLCTGGALFQGKKRRRRGAATALFLQWDNYSCDGQKRAIGWGRSPYCRRGPDRRCGA